MIKRWGLVCIALVFWAGGAPAEEAPIGSFITVSGSATLVSTDKTAAVSVGMKVHQKDTVITGPDGSVGVVFKDDTRLSLGPDSKITLDEYVFDPAKGNFSMVTRIAHGTAAYISGKMGTLSPEAVEFKTPSASLTIRGTHFLAKVEER